MCTPSTPKPEKPDLVPPAEAPKPLASPEDGGTLNLSQLRLGSKNNLKMRSASGLTLSPSS